MTGRGGLSLTLAGWKQDGSCHPVWFQGVDGLWSSDHMFIRLEDSGINAL